MAQAKNKTLPGVELLECPVCLETMSPPIFQCQSGHSLCSSCTTSLCPPICPMCRQPMTQMRNWQLEDIIVKAQFPCPNKEQGCVYTLVSNDLEEHLKECIFRDMTCPIGAVFGKCQWSGKPKEMHNHFKSSHAQYCHIDADADIDLNNVSIAVNKRFMYFYAHGKLLFIVTFKIDTLQKMAYWLVQHIGSKKTARQHVYEIHVASKNDNRKKVTFTDHCFNDAMTADDVFRDGKCAAMPLSMLSHFINERKLSFRFAVKRMPPILKKSENNTEKLPMKGSQGPRPRPHSARPKKPAHFKQRSNSAGPTGPRFNNPNNP